MKEFIAGKNDAGMRLDRFVAKAAPLLPASLAQKYIRIKRVKVGGRGSTRDYKITPGDIIQMYINDEFFEKADGKDEYLKIANPALEIVYEDDNIMLINKPAGVLCHSSNDYDYGSLISRVHAYLHQNGQWKPREENSFTPALCNRIDRNTAGIVIAAKNAESLRIINEKIKLREIDKLYLAVVHGVPSRAAGRLEGYIFKDAVKNQVYVARSSSPGAKSAVMEYNTVASAGMLSLLKCKLITGRTHQIRAQLADMGHPLLGDGKYGSERLNKPYGERYQALCSYKVVFAFGADAGLLGYLDKRSFEISDIAFVKKYFSSIDF